MNSSSAKLLVLTGERFACIKIVGRANFATSIDFRTLVDGLQEKAFNYFVLELSECALMDSTFLGMLAGFGLKMNGAQNVPSDSQVELLNPSPRITELLENLGVLHLFRVTDGALKLPVPVQPLDCPPANPCREEVTRACLEAHRILMEINPQNVARFKEVAQFLAEDLKRLGTEKS
jgi:anti-anti-sigma regulatory factor